MNELFEDIALKLNAILEIKEKLRLVLSESEETKFEDFYKSVEKLVALKEQYRRRVLLDNYDGIEGLGEYIPIITDDMINIPSYSFAYSTITGINFPEGTTKLNTYVMSQCKKLKKVTLPESLERIEDAALTGCSALTSLIIPENVTHIGQKVFDGCSSLSTIKLPDSFTEIPIFCFFGSGITEYEIPENITKICRSAFEKAANLNRLVIPENVTVIDGYSLRIGSEVSENGVKHGTAIIIMKSKNPISINTTVFNKTWIKKILVPKESLEIYKTATNWSDFVDYIEAEEDYEG